MPASRFPRRSTPSKYFESPSFDWLDDDADQSTSDASGAMPDVAISVEQLATQIARVVAADPILSDISVRGEISNFKAHSSGHCYLTLKDEGAQMRCCVWRAQAQKLSFKPNDGDRVVAHGRVDFYGKRGEISFIVDELRFDGQGALYEAFERLKLQLEAEGLFDPERKRALPPLPRRIGLITSATGAVAHDVLTVLRRRYPIANVVLIPAQVQGFDAVPDLLRALSWAAALEDLDVLIMARGGGSAEDLWCFNDEDIARAVAEFPIPVISAIGHETDFTILDFVADLRAPTPSAAAEMVAPDLSELQAILNGYRLRLHHGVAGEVQLARQKLDWLRSRHVLTHPQRKIEDAHARLQQARTRVQAALGQRVKIERQNLIAHRAQLHALDPQRVLERGYALLARDDGTIITGAGQTLHGEKLKIALHDGQLQVTVDESTLKPPNSN